MRLVRRHLAACSWRRRQTSPATPSGPFGADGSPTIAVAGFDLQQSHLVPEVTDPADVPAVTARDVVDRETLKAFVDGALDYFDGLYEAEGYEASLKIKRVFRDPNGPWRAGPVYLFIIDRNGFTLFHGAFPEKFEFQAPTDTLRDAVTGELILPQIIEAATGNPEGGFVEYHFDNPDDDTDSAAIPKVTYARERTLIANVPGVGSLSRTFIVGSGFYIVPSAMQPFFITDKGGDSLSSRGASPSMLTGYGQVAVDEGMTPPAGLAIFSFRQNGVLVSEASVPAAATVLEGRIFAETDDAVKTDVAIANPNDSAATIDFFFTDSKGIDYGHGSFRLGPREQMSGFLNPDPFLDPDPFKLDNEVWGTFTFNSNLPVAAIALRGFLNERSEFLVTTLSVAPLTAGTAGTVYFPHFAAGAGWTTQVILVNPTHAPISGRVLFFSPGSETAAAGPATLTLADGRNGSTFTYSIPPRSATRLQTSNPAGPLQVGSVRVTANFGSLAPSGMSIFSFKSGGVTVSEAGVPAPTPGAAFRVYVEASGTGGQPHSVRSGIALANTSGRDTVVSLELAALDGTATGLTESLTIPAGGQVARVIDDFFPALTMPFAGILRIASTAPDIAVLGLRMTRNQRNEIVVTTTPPSDENSPPTVTGLNFPYLADSGGWTTQFILYGVSTGQASSGSLRFTGQNGQPLELLVTPTAAPTIP